MSRTDDTFRAAARSDLAALSAQTEACRALLAENERLQGILRLTAPSAASYNSRVYQIHQYPEVLPYLTDEDLRQNQERPSAADARAASERDAALAAQADVKLIRTAICDPGQFLPRGGDYTETIESWSARAVVAALADAAAAPKEPTP